MRVFEDLRNNELQWLPELGIGYYPVTESPYGGEYFAKYIRMDQTQEAEILTQARISLCGDADPEKTLDIGIGGGKFVSDFGCYGFDVNQFAIDWLKDRNFYGIPEQGWSSMTFWDSLEHIHDPTELLSYCRENAFISMPIYRDSQHILQSKHFRKDEHCWYFTDEGLKRFMLYFGFECVRQTVDEQPIREDIHSYHFRRVES